MDVGDLVPLTIQVRDETATLVNATTVALSITLPDGTIVTPTVTSPPAVTGQYQYDYVATMVGRYVVRWNISGPPGAYTDTFDVRDTAAQSIISLAEAKKHLNMSTSITKDDEELREMIASITAVIERIRGEAIVPRTVVEEDPMGNGWRIVLQNHPVASVTSIISRRGIPYETQYWQLDGQMGTLTRTGLAPLVFGWDGLIVTYKVGYSQIPANYILAAKIILQHLWSTQRIQNVGIHPARGAQAAREEQIMTPAGMGIAIPARAVELLGSRASMIV